MENIEDFYDSGLNEKSAFLKGDNDESPINKKFSIDDFLEQEDLVFSDCKKIDQLTSGDLSSSKPFSVFEIIDVTFK